MQPAGHTYAHMRNRPLNINPHPKGARMLASCTAVQCATNAPSLALKLCPAAQNQEDYH